MGNINIVAKAGEDGRARVAIGKDVITLEDHTTHTFETNEIVAFVDYCKDFGVEGKRVFYSEKAASLKTATPDRYSRSDAICFIRKTPFIELLAANGGDRGMGLEEFEEFLFTMRPFLDDAGLALYSYVRNFSVSKVTSIKREVDNKGNFNYQVTKEKGGLTDVEIPESLAFVLPVIEGAKPERFAFDVFFTWHDTPTGCAVSFKLKNPMLLFEILNAVKTALLDLMTPLTCPKYWGDTDKHIQDNGWESKLNGLDERDK